MLNEFCLFELILCVFESCQVGLPGLKQYLEEINVSYSRTQTAAVSQVRLEPVTLRSRVKHSTIKSLRSLIRILPQVGIHQSVHRALKLHSPLQARILNVLSSGVQI